MGLLRPATPGFLCTLTATILLAVVSFCVPYFKSVYFLKATISESGVTGSITFGTLGYCLELSNGTTCSSPSVGYELDINSLVGNELPIEIPTVVVKWITYALVLHIVALAFSAGSSVFGLLAHVREMSMACCSTCVAGFAAAVALLAFIFDLVLFFVAKSRINAVGSAEMGNAIWLTLAAWVLLFFSGCFYTIGRCCISNRKPRGDWDRRKDAEQGGLGGRPDFGEQMRMDAVKAEQDRKAMQNQKEVGLAPLPETQPLTARVEGDQVYYDQPYSDHIPGPVAGGYGGRPAGNGGYMGGGYSPAPAGTRAVDEYHNPTQQQQASYPPPRRQGSGHTTAYAPSTYVPSTYQEPQRAMPPANNQYLSTTAYSDPYGVPNHTAGGSSYHSAASHQQYPSSYSQYDSYDAQPIPASPPMPNANSYVSTQYHSAASLPERNYTLGGDGYGANSVPPLPNQEQNSYLPYPGDTPHSPSPINTGIAPTAGYTSPGGPRTYRTMSPQQQYEGSPPPGYDGPLSNTQIGWGGKS